MSSIQDMVCLDDCCVPCVEPEQESIRAFKKRIKNMYAQTAANLVVQAAPTPAKDESKAYAERRLSDIYDEKVEELRETFEMDGVQPKTIAEAKKWLKDGNYRFTFPKGWTEEAEIYWPMEYFNWGKTDPDKEGYEAAVEKVRDARTVALDVIRIKTDEDARLTAVQTFAAL